MFLYIIFGLLIRIIVSLGQAYGDIKLFHIPWANDILKYGFTGFYERNIVAGSAIYPPIAIYMFTICNYLGTIVKKPIMDILWQLNITVPIFPSMIFSVINERQILLAFMKIPAIIADIFISLGVYSLSKGFISNKTSRIPLIIFLSLLFNPAVIFNSASWGQIDIIPLTFCIWSIYFLYKKRFNISFLFFILGMLSKQTISMIVPIYGILLIYYSGWKKIINYSLIGVITIFLLFIPFYKNGNILLFPFITYFKIATLFGGDAMSAHAFNFWWLTNGFGHLRDTFIIMNNISFSLIIKFVLLIQISILIFLLLRKKFNLLLSIFTITLLNLFVFLFSTRMHERHLLPVIPFLLLSSIIDFKFYYLFLYVTFFHLINMYAAWGQPELKWLIVFSNNKIIDDFLTIILIGIYFYLLYFFLNLSLFNRKKTISVNTKLSRVKIVK